MSDPTDAEVLLRVRQGDCRAYLLLFDRYYQAVERYALCLLEGDAEATVTVSAVFEQGFREARRRGEVMPAYPAHLFVLCRRRAPKAFGARRAPLNLSPGPSSDWNEQCAPYLDELPLSIILCRERDALVRAALSELPMEDREIVHLAFEPDLCRKDIGIILKQPRDEVVTAHLFRALRRLGAAVQRAGHVEQAPAGGRPSYVQPWTRT